MYVSWLRIIYQLLFMYELGLVKCLVFKTVVDERCHTDIVQPLFMDSVWEIARIKLGVQIHSQVWVVATARILISCTQNGRYTLWS